ncbi:MAG: hypothetical protein LBG87_08570 [Spirochaetaceae bacterium]|jgi:hypothetical protein|nr:hypothetical protein [Spirochaetaceae bacterium]
MRCARSSGLGLRKTAVGFMPFVRFFSGTFCPSMELLRNSFIAAVKTF